MIGTTSLKLSGHQLLVDYDHQPAEKGDWTYPGYPDVFSVIRVTLYIPGDGDHDITDLLEELGALPKITDLAWKEIDK